MKRSWFTIKAKAGGKSVTVDILDEIGLWGVTASDFARELKAVGDDIETVRVRLNSPGGSMWDAAAIHTILSNLTAHVTVEVIGVAASAASFILTAADEVRIAKNAFIMVHMPQLALAGESSDLRHAADLLDKVAANMVDAYAHRMKKDADEVRAMLAVETWFTAEEAVAAGLADKVIGEISVTANFDVRRHVRTLPAGFTRLTNLKESSMEDVKLEDLSDEARAALETEVRAKIEAEATAKAAEEAAAAEAAANANNGNTNAEALQIVDACALAGKPEAAAEYLRAGKKLSDVMADLRTKIAANGGPLNTRRVEHENRPSDDLSSLDVAAIYDKANRKK